MPLPTPRPLILEFRAIGNGSKDREKLAMQGIIQGCIDGSILLGTQLMQRKARGLQSWWRLCTRRVCCLFMRRRNRAVGSCRTFASSADWPKLQPTALLPLARQRQSLELFDINATSGDSILNAARVSPIPRLTHHRGRNR